MEQTRSQEKLIISSGSVVCIDQFMLGNSQLHECLDEGVPLNEAVARYGGAVFTCPNGEYHVYRDAELQVVAVAPADSTLADTEEGLGSVIEDFGPEASAQAHVRIDTRCVVLADSALVTNKELIESFSALRQNDKEKEARDLLRGAGAAVRYGFNKWGDELSLFSRTEPSVLAALWPE